jgi:hypothetical protein
MSPAHPRARARRTCSLQTSVALTSATTCCACTAGLAQGRAADEGGGAARVRLRTSRRRQHPWRVRPRRLLRGSRPGHRVQVPRGGADARARGDAGLARLPRAGEVPPGACRRSSTRATLTLTSSPWLSPRAAAAAAASHRCGRVRSQLFTGDGGAAIDQIPALPIWLWGGMLAGIGYCEQVRIAKGWAKLDPETQTSSTTLRPGTHAPPPRTRRHSQCAHSAKACTCTWTN